MNLRPSVPSLRRKVAAASLLGVFGVVASLIRLSRADFNLLPVLVPLDFHGTSTSFFVCLANPFVAFILNDEVDIAYYLKLAFGVAVGISLYEVIQIWIPARTFDLYDIIASFVGASVSVVIALVLFLRD
ncbi:hypothetical protein OAM01_02170 [bacterium]|nr:hypothetical protein [bacterium]